MGKLYDLAVKAGSYESNGETKHRWKNVGSVWESRDGGQYIRLDRSFNPAGVPFKEGDDTILVSMFEPKEKDQGGGRKRHQEDYGWD